MKPFRLPPWRKKQIKDKFIRKNRVVSGTISEMERIMRTAVDAILDPILESKITDGEPPWVPPDLGAMDQVSERFYRSVIEQAWLASEHEKRMQQDKKRLAARSLNQPKVPPLADLEAVFRDRRFWPSLMKRSSKLTERLRKSYLQKLRRKFKELVPAILDGSATPQQAKAHMMRAWDASKSRVEVIFRTETTKYFAETQIAFFSGDPEIIGFLFDSIPDQARTRWCRTRHGLVYRPGSQELRENTPPCHWHCRSHLIALAKTPYNLKMLEDPDRDPQKRTVEPLPVGWR